jgi:hypothetical protein
MKKQILSEELLRMKRLAGLISESQYAENINETMEQTIKDFVNKYLEKELQPLNDKSKIKVPASPQSGEYYIVEDPSAAMVKVLFKILIDKKTLVLPLKMVSQIAQNVKASTGRNIGDDVITPIATEFIQNKFSNFPFLKNVLFDDSTLGPLEYNKVFFRAENVQENKGMLHEVMDDITDANTATEWISGQLEEYMENSLDGYGMGYHVEERLDKLLGIISKKFNIPADSFKVEYNYDTSYNEYNEGTIDGTVSLNGIKVVDYSSHNDGYGFRGEIDKNALKAELAKFIKPISESLLGEGVDVSAKVDEFAIKKEKGLRMTEVIYQLVDIINDEGDEDIISYYPGWQREDFINLLTQMEDRRIIDNSWREDVVM